MNEKRFMLDDAGELIDKETAQFIEYGEKVCDLLNELATKCSQLKKENEQLKSFVEYEKRQHKHWKRECLENIKEIGQLKREIVQLKGDV